VKVFTAHLKPQAPPCLVREGFSFWAFLFGPWWLLAHGAWVPGLLVLVADGLLGWLVPAPASLPVELAAAVLTGLYGQDLRRWSLALHGWILAAVVAGQTEDAAFARLLTVRPELVIPAAGTV
jgi:Protein of unknown function (DUF2628)